MNNIIKIETYPHTLSCTHIEDNKIQVVKSNLKNLIRPQSIHLNMDMDKYLEDTVNKEIKDIIYNSFKKEMYSNTKKTFLYNAPNKSTVDILMNYILYTTENKYKYIITSGYIEKLIMSDEKHKYKYDSKNNVNLFGEKYLFKYLEIGGISFYVDSMERYDSEFIFCGDDSLIFNTNVSILDSSEDNKITKTFNIIPETNVYSKNDNYELLHFSSSIQFKRYEKLSELLL
jgi:hypothetical protein